MEVHKIQSWVYIEIMTIVHTYFLHFDEKN